MLQKIKLFVIPLAFIIVITAFESPQIRVLAISLLMVSFWTLEVMPMAVVALLPLVVFPLLNIMSLREVCVSFADPVIFLFMGGLFLAMAIEKWKLHLRISLNIVKCTGTNADMIILGFMLATFVLSMWMSNTATTVMMLPIAGSVITLLEKQIPKGSQQEKNFSISTLLGIAYAASIGGVSTLIGTPPNAVLAGYLSSAHHYTINFGSWMLFALPLALLVLFVMYFLLVKVFCKNGIGNLAESAAIFRQEIQNLGKMGKGETLVLVVFIITALLWTFSSYLNQIFPTIKLNDTIIAVISLISLFAIPVNLKKGEFILSWKDTEKLSWDILLLFGGGISLATAMEKVGIIASVGGWIQSLNVTEVTLMLIILAFLTTLLTEVMSNVALAAVMIPVASGIGVDMGQSPLLFAVPVALASSFAFMLPIATPPNAIVFSSGKIRIKDMIKLGFLPNLIGIIIVIGFCRYLLPIIFNFTIN
jgi:sodium-dependent dicarboxylate transporter 2/3/5